MKLVVEDLACGYNNRTVIECINFTISSGEILAILGPNGVGKTTFYKTLLGFLRKKEGKVLYNGKKICQFHKKELSKVFAYVPQASKIVFGFSVKEVLLMGRYTHMKQFLMPSKDDESKVYEVLESLNIMHLADKNFNQISGGEQQLVLIARAIVQDSKVIVMDEPTANLDYGNQLKVLKVISKLKEKNHSIIMTTHVPEHAYHYCCKTMIFYDGRMHSYGDSTKIITDKVIREIYQLEDNINLNISIFNQDSSLEYVDKFKVSNMC